MFLSMCLLVIDEVKCCFTEAGKGSITLADLMRVAAAHDFTWIDKDIADMIYCFGSDGDGKVNTHSSLVIFYSFFLYCW